MEDRERELVETLEGIRRYVENQIRIAVSRIYLGWAIGGFLACLAQEVLLSTLPPDQIGPVVGLLWFTVFSMVWLDTARNFSRVRVLLKLAGKEEYLESFQKERKRSVSAWLVAGLIGLLSYWLVSSTGLEQAMILSILAFVGSGNLVMWLITRSPLESLLVGVSLLVAVPLMAILPPSIARVSGCLLISLTYALAGISIYLRWT